MAIVCLTMLLLSPTAPMYLSATRVELEWISLTATLQVTPFTSRLQLAAGSPSFRIPSSIRKFSVITVILHFLRSFLCFLEALPRPLFRSKPS